MPQILDPAEVDAALRQRGLHWERRGGELVKVVVHPNFAAALAYVNEVGGLAEAANHHPDVDIRWGTVTLRLSTHSVGALTSADLRLAEEVDAITGPAAGSG
jgi:4a-hydroxytetrahydrobiopterin dehydratase